MHPNLEATAKRNAEIVRRVEAGDSMSSVAREYEVTPARVRQIVTRSQQPAPPFGLGKNAVTLIRRVLKIEGRPVQADDVMTFVENGHLHTRHPNFGQRSVDAISAAFVAYRDDKQVMGYLVRSPGAFDDAMTLKKRSR
ncbi:hypothetical protein [Aureimonas glaciei]|uniref:Uncharacterized protein n=1 Tax=Aureimonas glaciei TaxID=1776957 RepID=A0A916YCB4_9HYPH|nr:hypothetical protein [Aureimonas glaciei]GGD39071.1 hypothetical protein GCM10011335_47330 [Aureimonas glaciei]